MPSLRSMTVTTHLKDEETDPYISQIVHYDQQGLEVAHYEFRGPDEFESKTETRYDSQGKIVEQTTYQNEQEILERKVFTRDEAGRVTRVDISYPDGSLSVQTIERDEETRTENWIEKDEDGELESREFLKYDEKGQITLREWYDYRDKLTEAYEYQYDEAGNLILRRHLDERRKLIVVTDFQYNEAGLLVLRANRNRRGELSDYLKMEYNEKGQPIKHSFSGKYTILFEYDEQGNVAVEEQYQGSELQNRITYEYNNLNRVLIEDQATLIKTYAYVDYDN
ncbi:MAG: hypothetical protein M0P69_10490 [Bacteroidales bacterium]|nr:hypothetical protein [Bacteroidales bacterium]